MELRTALEKAWGSMLGEQSKNRNMVRREIDLKEQVKSNMGIGKDLSNFTKNVKEVHEIVFFKVQFFFEGR